MCEGLDGAASGRANVGDVKKTTITKLIIS